MFERDTIYLILATAIGTYIAVNLFEIQKSILKRINFIQLEDGQKPYLFLKRFIRPCFEAAKLIIPLMLIVFVLLSILTFIDRSQPGVEIICQDSSSQCTSENIVLIHNRCRRQANVWAAEHYDMGRLRNIGSPTIEASKRDYFSLCVMERGLETKSCKKGEPNCW